MALIIKKGNYTIVGKDDNESVEDLYKRGWFIVSQLDNNELKTQDLIMYSKLWKNINKLKCVYDNDIMNIISKCENNLYSIKSEFNHN